MIYFHSTQIHKYKRYDTGKFPLCIVSGKKDNFDVSPVIQPGKSDNITIRQNSDKKFMFGPYSETDLKQDKNQVHINLFDAQQASNVKKINIWKSEPDGKIEVSMLLTEEATPQPMESLGTKHFREADRITKKDWLGWILPNSITAGTTVLSSILTAATGKS